MADAKGVVQLDLTGLDKFTEFAKIFQSMKNDVAKFQADSAKNAAYNSKLGELSASLKKSQNDVDKSIKNLNKDLRETIKFSADVAKNFFSIGLSLAKWMTFGSIAGGFGLGTLASSTSDSRRQAQGLGTSTGDLRAAKVNFGKYINPENALGNIADIKGDLSRSYILSMLCGKAGENPAEMLPTLMKNAVRLFKRGGENEQTAKAMKLTEIFPMEDLRRLANATRNGEEELNKTIEAFQEDRKKLANSDKENESMQDFWTQLKRSGDVIETVLVGALAPLAKPLSNLAEAISGAIAAFLKSDEVKNGLENLTEWLNSPKSKQAMSDFFTGLSDMGKYMLKIGGGIDTATDIFSLTGKGLGDFIGFLSQGNLHQYLNPNEQVDPNAKPDQTDQFVEYRKKLEYKIAYDKSNHPELETFFSSVESKNKLPEGLLEKLRFIESSGNNNAVSEKGAQGPFQLKPDAAKQYGVADSFNLKDSAQGTGKLLHHLMEKYHDNLADALAAYNWGEGNLDHYIRGDKGYSRLPKETTDYLHKFNINVTTSAGSDLNVIATAMK